MPSDHPARDDLLAVLTQGAIALRNVDQMLDPIALRRLREVRSRGTSTGFILTLRQPGPGERVTLDLAVIDDLGRRTQLVFLPRPAEIEED